MTVGVGLPAGLQQRRALRKTNRPAWNAADDFVVLTVDEPQLAKKHAHPSPSDRASSPTTLTHSSHVSLSSPNRPSSRGSSGSESSWRSSRTRQPPAACDERNEQVGTFKSLDPAAGHISVKSSIRSGSRHDEESGDAESSKGRDCATGCHNLSILTEASSGDDDPKGDSYSIRHVKVQNPSASVSNLGFLPHKLLGLGQHRSLGRSPERAPLERRGPLWPELP